MAKIIVLDTSFLIELFQIPVDSNPDKHQPAIDLLQNAIAKNHDIYCPLSVLYELANHIIDIKSHDDQRRIAQTFTSMVIKAWEEEIPFTIIPSSIDKPEQHEIARLPELCETYQANIRQGLDLTDCTIIDAAYKLKANYHSRSKKWPAHIWSLHQALKALEPDNFGHALF